MGVVIEVTNLSKAYQIGEFSTGTLTNDVSRWWALMRGKEDPFLKVGEVNDRTVKGESKIVWSLRDINFEINEGDAVGIIGKNGAGKSTLLKVLSRITTPSQGSVKLKGRIASLLEVGTGFHPELTGRENIFLNGAILGMKKIEIKKKFDEIVSFSGVERYIDTPVKRYSSGMYVRLAFAVAAHLDCEILIIDEVLAVGDADFQNKCLGKMGDISKREGRTVLFVSHHMGNIAQLCNRAILLSNGAVAEYNSTGIVIDNYLNKSKSYAHNYIADLKDKPIVITEAYFQNHEAVQTSGFYHTQEIQIIAKVLFNELIRNVELRIVLRNKSGKAVFTSDFDFQGTEIAEKQELTVKAIIPKHFIRPGEYSLTLALFVPHQFIVDAAEDVLILNIMDVGSKYSASEGFEYGDIFFNPEWNVINQKQL
jgi:lipopolysaccharide transport system ATP-binding protein